MRKFLIFLFLLSFLLISSAYIMRFSGSPPADTGCVASGTMVCWGVDGKSRDADLYIYSQKVKNAASLTICQVDLYLYTTAGDCTAHVEIMDSADNSAAGQYGGDSGTETITGSTPATYSFTWSSSKPNPTGDFWIHLITETGTTLAWRVIDATDAYEDTTYDLFQDDGVSVVDANDDGKFKVYTE